MFEIAGGIILAVIGLYGLLVVLYWLLSAFQTGPRMPDVSQNCPCCGLRTRERYCPRCRYGIRPVTTVEEREYW